MYYEIEGTNVRILGSLHMFPSTSPALPGWVEAAYQWAQNLVVESEPDRAAFLQYSRLPAGDQLSNHLPPALVARVHSLWAPILSRSDFEQMKPWFAWISLVGRLVDFVPGVEQQLLPRARLDFKPILELETIGEVPEMLDGVPDRAVEDALEYCVADTARARGNFLAMHAAWAARDGAEVYRLASSVPSFVSELGQIAIRDRNTRWVPRLMPGLGTAQRTLVMVGAAHLFGVTGLLAGLRVASRMSVNQLP